jgi:hypothetical protein
MHGEKKTGTDGVVSLSVPKDHEIDCKVTASGHATLEIRSDRAWGQYDWRQTWIDWQFSPQDPAKPWVTRGGSVETDVDSASVMNLTVYLPASPAENIPSYGPMRIYHEASGTKPSWTKEPSVIRTQ